MVIFQQTISLPEGSPKSSIDLGGDFPWNKPSSYWGPPHLRETPYNDDNDDTLW